MYLRVIRWNERFLQKRGEWYARVKEGNILSCCKEMHVARNKHWRQKNNKREKELTFYVIRGLIHGIYWSVTIRAEPPETAFPHPASYRSEQAREIT